MASIPVLVLDVLKLSSISLVSNARCNFVLLGTSTYCFVSRKCRDKRLHGTQKHDFSDSTPRAGSDRLQKSSKSLLSALQILSLSQIGTQKCGQVISTLFRK